MMKLQEINRKQFLQPCSCQGDAMWQKYSPWLLDTSKNFFLLSNVLKNSNLDS